MPYRTIPWTEPGKEVAWIQRVSGTPVKAGFVNYKLQTRKHSGRILKETKHL
jgi:hypothetical protein